MIAETEKTKSMELYELIKDVNSPEFAMTIEKGTLFPMSRIKLFFPHLSTRDDRFNDWFKVSEKYHIVHCRLEEIK